MKKFLRWFFSGIIIAVVLSGTAMTAQATSPVPMPQVPLALPTPDPFSAPKSPGDVSPPPAQTQGLTGLKAVLVVGPIDGDSGEWTNTEKNNMERAANVLASNGVTLHKFYTPDNDWNQIKAAAQDAHFFLYRGHGVYWPPPDLPSPPVGGLALKNRIISPDEIRTGLHLAPGAIVMLYACFAAGTSSVDTAGIGSAEAQRRVAQYSDPFLDIGASGYYANWYGNAFQAFLTYLFQGMTLGEAYEAYFDFNPETVERFAHPQHPGRAMWLDKNYWSEMWKYSNAFTGSPGETLASLFDPRAMVVNPLVISLVSEPDSPAKAYDLDIDCTTSEPFDWTAEVESESAAWLSLQPALSGLSGQSVTAVLDPTGLNPGTYYAAIRILAGDPSLRDGDQTISVELKVSDELHQVFLPIVMR